MRDNAQIIPGYTLLERLGQGGQGDVFLARHDHGGATMVALKLLRDMRLEDRAALRREVELLRQIDHPGVVQVLHAELDHTPPWYTMELIQGPTLRHMLARLHPQQQQASGHWWTAHLEHDTHPSPKPSPHTGIATQEPSSPPPPPAHDPMPLPDRDTQLGLLRKLALNLAALHAQGLVHRDLKPENVILRDGNPLQPVLVDFGLATLSEDGGGRARLAPSIHKAGTLAYMAPEQLRGDLVDARADLYALGCLLFELWTGELPWANGDALRRTGVASPAQMQMLFPEGEPELMTLCRRLLDPNPKSRLSYAVDAVAQLNAVQGQPPAPNVPPSDLYLYPPPFVGRDRLLDALVGFGQTALERHRHEAILIAGAKGIGKTRIALEMARLFRRMSLTLDVIEGRCTEPLLPLEGLRPFWNRVIDRCYTHDPTWAQTLLAPYTHHLLPLLPELQPLLPNHTQHPSSETVTTARAMARAMRDYACHHPTLLFIDDTHRADPLTMEILGCLSDVCRTEQQAALVMVMTCSSNDADGLARIRALPRVRALTLDALAPQDTTHMIREMLAWPGPPLPMLTTLVHTSQGNPFRLAEALREALDTQRLRRIPGQGWVWQSP